MPSGVPYTVAFRANHVNTAR